MDLDDLKDVKWPYPWALIGNEQECLQTARIMRGEVFGGRKIAPTIVEELKSEIGSEKHPLFNVECRAVAYNTRNFNEYILLTAKPSMYVTWVHLTWSVEQKPEWPSVRGFQSLDEWITEVRKYNQSRPLTEKVERVEHDIVKDVSQSPAKFRPSATMRLLYPYEPINPITSTEDFLDRRARASKARNWHDFSRSLPHILISRCPYCNQDVWMEAGLIFSLTDNFWFRAYSDGRGDIVTPDSLCKHLFCVDGALNLNGNQPTEAKKWHDVSYGNDWDYIWIASEVPFVKPRVMKLPTMLTVIHSFPVANGKYTAYPIVYFAEQRPDETEYCIAWATKKHFTTGVGPGVGLIGTRSDEQDYDLENWGKRDSIYWLDVSIENYSLQSQPFKDFPYHQIPGRQHPYIIEEGRVQDLPVPKQGKADYILEHDSTI